MSSNPDYIEAEEVTNVPALREEAQVAKPEQTAPLTLVTRAFIDDPYVGAAEIELTKEQIATLEKYRRVAHDKISIKPDDGLIYMDHMGYREVLNEAFGPGKWSLVPAGDFKVEDNGKAVTLYRTYRFYINGKFLREAVGAGTYFKSNSKMNYADAAETCESDVLKRMLKPFGIAGQCWDRRYQEWFKATYCKRGSDGWKRVRWDEAGWWDGKTKELPEEGNREETVKTEPTPPSGNTGRNPVVTGLVAKTGTVGKSHYVDVDDVRYFTDSDLVLKTAEEFHATNRPVSFEYTTTTTPKGSKVAVITAWDLTD